MLAEVEARAWSAFKDGSDTNPYPAEDKRHERFRRCLANIQATAWVLDL